MTILAAMMSSLFLGACSSDAHGPSDSQRLRLDGVTAGCKDVQTICAESHPPQCFEYCADEAPGTGSGDCQPIAGVYQSCGGEPCAVGVDASGQEFAVCYPPDCVAAFDVETQTETLSCPPGVAPGGPGGSAPGDPGPGGGAEPGGPGSDEPQGL